MNYLSYTAKKLNFQAQEYTCKFLDAISIRQCYGCKTAYAETWNRFYCKNCYSHLLLDLQDSRKVLDFNYSDLNKFWDKQIPSYPKIYFASKYGALTKSLMRDYKYRKPHYADFWASELERFWNTNSDWILSDLSEEELLRYPRPEKSDKKLKLWLAAIPLHSSKEKNRGYNQAQLITKSLSKLIEKNRYLFQSASGLHYHELDSIELIDDLILRTKNTKSLFDKSKEERLEIMKDAFSLNLNFNYGQIKTSQENVLIIIDDISTTSSTFLSYQKALSSQHNIFDEIIFLAVCGRNYK